MAFFPGFTLDHVAVTDGTLRLRRGGSGPPLLLLHGNPQTHAMWHAVAPALAERFTVICPDLRGYGGSFKPAVTPDHAPYAGCLCEHSVAECGNLLINGENASHTCPSGRRKGRDARSNMLNWHITSIPPL